MAACTVTLNVNTAAISEAVKFEALANQVIDGVTIDTRLIIASASGTAYSADLIQEASYRVISDRFYFENPIFTVPASSTADLDDLLEAFRSS